MTVKGRIFMIGGTYDAKNFESVKSKDDRIKQPNSVETENNQLI